MAIKDYHEDSKRKEDLETKIEIEQRPKVFLKLSKGDCGNYVRGDKKPYPVKLHSVGGADIYPI